MKIKVKQCAEIAKEHPAMCSNPGYHARAHEKGIASVGNQPRATHTFLRYRELPPFIGSA